MSEDPGHYRSFDPLGEAMKAAGFDPLWPGWEVVPENMKRRQLLARYQFVSILLAELYDKSRYSKQECHQIICHILKHPEIDRRIKNTIERTLMHDANVAMWCRLHQN